MKHDSTTWAGRILVAALATFTVAASAGQGFGQLGEFTQRGMELWHVPGMAVAVVSDDSIEFSRGFGRTSLAGGEAVDEHTLFAIASTTKAMVVAGLLMLADEGRLSLDDPIIRHLPELHFAPPLDVETVMVRDLLSHRTGLPSTDIWSFLQDLPLDEQIVRLQSVSQESPIRTRLIYQNTMFELAGLVIERLSGERWDVFLRKRLWQPIGMDETFGARGQIPPDQSHVMPYMYLDDELVLSEWDLPADLADAAGSVWSSLHDMILWAQFLLRDGVTAGGERLISEAGFAAMFEPQQLAAAADFYPTVELTQPFWRSYALGWFQQDFQGRAINFHTGSLSGLIALIGLDLADDRAVIVLGNRDHAEMRHALLWEVMDNSEQSSRRDWNQDIFELYASSAAANAARWQQTEQNRLQGTRPARPLEAYAGTYRSERNGDLKVELSGAGLRLQTGRVELPLQHWQLETFLAVYRPWDLREFATFQINPEGELISLQVFGDVFSRVRPAQQAK